MKEISKKTSKKTAKKISKKKVQISQELKLLLKTDDSKVSKNEVYEDIYDSPWSRGDWLLVYWQLKSYHWEDWRNARHTIWSWLSARSSHVPHAVKATWHVLQAMELLHRSHHPSVEPGSLLSVDEQVALTVDNAIVRFTNCISEDAKRNDSIKDDKDKSLTNRCGAAGMPAQLAMLRNKITHQLLSDMMPMRSKNEAVELIFQKLKSYYWDPMYTSLEVHQSVEKRIKQHLVQPDAPRFVLTPQLQRHLLQCREKFSQREGTLLLNGSVTGAQSKTISKVVQVTMQRISKELSEPIIPEMVSDREKFYIDAVVRNILFKDVVELQGGCACQCRLRAHQVTRSCLAWLLLPHKTAASTASKRIFAKSRDVTDSRNYAKHELLRNNAQYTDQDFLNGMSADEEYIDNLQDFKSENNNIEEERITAPIEILETRSTLVICCLLEKIHKITFSDISDKWLRDVLTLCFPSKDKEKTRSRRCNYHSLLWDDKILGSSEKPDHKEALKHGRIPVNWELVIPKLRAVQLPWLQSFAEEIEDACSRQPDKKNAHLYIQNDLTHGVSTEQKVLPVICSSAAEASRKREFDESNKTNENKRKRSKIK